MTKRQQRLLDACKALLEMVGGPDGTKYGKPVDPGAVKREAAAAIADLERTTMVREAIDELIEERGKGTMGIYILEVALRSIVAPGGREACALVEVGGKLLHDCEGYKALQRVEAGIIRRIEARAEGRVDADTFRAHRNEQMGDAVRNHLKP